MKNLLTVYLSSVCLMATAAFLATPDYYAWTAFPLFFGAAAYFMMNNGRSRRLLLIAYACTVPVSFAVGRLFVQDGQVVGFGLTAIFLTIASHLVVLLYIYRPEAAPRAVA